MFKFLEKFALTELLLAISICLIASIAFTGCAGLTPKQTVGVSCESAASALDTLTAAKVAGRISQSDLQHAIEVYERAVVPVCVPVAENLGAVKKAALAAAVAELTARAGGVQ